MIYSITVPSERLPIAAQFVHYIHAREFGSELKASDWWAQDKETLTNEVLDDNETKLQQVMQSPAREHVRRALTVTAAMMAGNDQPLRQLIDEKEHIWIVGAPRTGGTYLLRECMRAVGKDYQSAWGPMYHDSFPPVTTFRREPQPGRSLKFIYAMAQYFVMASLEEGAVIPKKLHTLTAEPEFANRYLRNVYITERHPMDACMSMVVKGGGMPRDRRMPRDRIGIERQCWEMLLHHGADPDELRRLDYWDFYLRYWNLYRKESEALRGTRVQYHDLPNVARDIHERYGSEREPEPFIDTAYDRAQLERGAYPGGDEQQRGMGG